MIGFGHLGRGAAQSRPCLQSPVFTVDSALDSVLDSVLNAVIDSVVRCPSPRFYSMKSAISSFFLYLSSFLLGVAAEPTRILAIGDSITQGGKTFVTYRLPLDQKLRAAGLNYEFVGSQQSEGPKGPLWHEGYGGKNAEFLAGLMPPKLKAAKPDIILLHCGHNHSAEEKPVPGIIAAERAIIEAARKQNPKVVVLLALVIPSGKLPKYAYLPELNQAEVLLARELHRPDAPVLLVDLATGFDPLKDTIMDRVHPNAQGAEKMANKWFLALKPWVK